MRRNRSARRKVTGYVPIRRGILAHVRQGRMTTAEFAAYTWIILEADSESGIWWGSARALAGSYGISERSARHVLEGLEQKRYLKRFTTPGAHQNYPVLVEKYLVTHGVKQGLRLNAAATTDWRNPVYERVKQWGEETGEERGEESAPIQEREREEIHTSSKPEVSTAGALFPEAAEVRTDGQPHDRDLVEVAQAVYRHYIEAFGKQPALYRLTPQRQAMLKARARDALRIAREMRPDAGHGEWLRMAQESMSRCVDALKRSEFHAGQNDRGKKYQDLRHVFRSTEKFEEWLER